MVLEYGTAQTPVLTIMGLELDLLVCGVFAGVLYADTKPEGCYCMRED